jgi:hypothetical protein
LFLNCAISKLLEMSCVSVAFSPKINPFEPLVCCNFGFQSKAESAGIQVSLLKPKSNRKIATSRSIQNPHTSTQPAGLTAPNPAGFVASINGIFSQASIHPNFKPTTDTAASLHDQLDTAARTGDLETIKKCIERGVDIDRQTALSKQTALHACLACGKLEAAMLIVIAGADVYKQDAKGRSVLDFALLCQGHCFAENLKRHSPLTFAGAVATSCRFSMMNNAHMNHACCSRILMSALANIKGLNAVRNMNAEVRQLSITWGALTGVLMHRLSHQVKPTSAAFRESAHYQLMKTSNRGSAMMRITGALK